MVDSEPPGIAAVVLNVNDVVCELLQPVPRLSGVPIGTNGVLLDVNAKPSGRLRPGMY